MTIDRSLVNEVLPLGQLLRDVGSLPWQFSLYTATTHPFTLNTPAAVIDQDDVDAPDAEPEFAVQHRLKYALGVNDLRGVFGNAEAQLDRRPSPDEFLRALNFYMSRDAYVDFRETGAGRA